MREAVNWRWLAREGSTMLGGGQWRGCSARGASLEKWTCHGGLKQKRGGRELGLCLGEAKAEWGFWYCARTSRMERGVSDASMHGI
jgi:hypothetical protein